MKKCRVPLTFAIPIDIPFTSLEPYIEPLYHFWILPVLLCPLTKSHDFSAEVDRRRLVPDAEDADADVQAGSWVAGGGDG